MQLAALEECDEDSYRLAEARAEHAAQAVAEDEDGTTDLPRDEAHRGDEIVLDELVERARGVGLGAAATDPLPLHVPGVDAGIGEPSAEAVARQVERVTVRREPVDENERGERLLHRPLARRGQRASRRTLDD
jgi:hypothetical protein